MTVIKALFAGLSAVSLCFSQGVSISGKVTDTAGAALSGAVVALERGGQTATTGADGKFTLSGNPAVFPRNSRLLPKPLCAEMRNGVLFVHVDKRSDVLVSAYTLQGRLVSIIRRTMEAGTNRVAPGLIGAGIFVYKVSSGKSEVLIKSNQAAGPHTAALRAGALAKQAGADAAMRDVIAVTKAGFLNFRVAVTNSDTSGIDIKMIASAGTVTDAGGNVYQTVKIGSQTWTVENLRTTKYNDGTPIPLAVSLSEWAVLSTPGYCYYGSTTNADSIRKFGALYNWYAVNTKKLAPAGWHVPDTLEWLAMQNYLVANGFNWDGTTADNKIGKALAAKADWSVSTVDGAIGNDLTKNNRTGFSAMPGGSRYYDVDCNYIGQMGIWWTATAADDAHAYYRMLSNSLDFLDLYQSASTTGFSVRLVKD